METFQVDDIKGFSASLPVPVVTPGPTGRIAPTNAGTTARSYGVAFCPRPQCKAPVLVWFELPNAFLVQGRNPSEAQQKLIYSGPRPIILGTWPTAPQPDDSVHWPESLREIFREVQEDLKAKRNAARIVGTCRSVLEVALAKLGYPKSDGSLQTRINKAQADGHITKGMAEWSKKIKVDGNEAIHELSADRADAEALVNFIRTFLDVAFDLPEKIKGMGGQP